jgi:hypothetical protein
MLIGVVAHANREALATKLIDEVQADVYEFDRTWPPSVTGCAGNHIRVLKGLNRIAANSTRHTWCVVLEDDAIPVNDFRNHVEWALPTADGPLIGLYLGSGNPQGVTQRVIVPAVEDAKAADASWIVADWFISTVGYVVHSAWLSDLIAAISDMTGPVDNRINDWTQGAGLETWYCHPSLVDHEDDDSMLATHRPYLRHAHVFGARDEWTRKAVDMGCAEGWCHEIEENSHD